MALDRVNLEIIPHYSEESGGQVKGHTDIFIETVDEGGEVEHWYSRVPFVIWSTSHSKEHAWQEFLRRRRASLPT